jgi:hypothetical protein
MVVVNEKLVRQVMEQRGWSETHLAAAMDVHFNTARNMLAGQPVGHNTQMSLVKAFEDRFLVSDLFLLAGDDREAQPAGHETAK